MQSTTLILFLLIGLATSMSIYEALYPEDTFEDLLRSKSSLENAAMRVDTPDYKRTPSKRDIPIFRQMTRLRICKGSSIFRINC